jgi:Domain of unknown function (DUF927)
MLKTQSTTRRTPITPKYTIDLSFPAIGESEKEGRFLKVTRGAKHVILSLRQLGLNQKAEMQRLESLGVTLIMPQAQSEFIARSQEASYMAPTFKVATKIGWYQNAFVLPLSAYPKGQSKFEIHLSETNADVHSRFRCSGASEKMIELYRLCRGNSRLIFVQALSFVGPICEPFGLRAPAFQLVGKGGRGKSTPAVVAGANWGGDPRSDLGFATSWNGTPNGLEEYPPALHQTLMILDETALLPTANGRPLLFAEALMRLAQGQSKKRANGTFPERWSTPLLSTSNASVIALLDDRNRENYEAFVDRLIDINMPGNSASFYEDLHGFSDKDSFSIHLANIARNNFGHSSCAFLKRLIAGLAADRAGIKSFVAARVAGYKKESAGIASAYRDLLRAGGHFATVYAAGSLAIRLKILPFSPQELLDAILRCHRDHAAFIDDQIATFVPGAVTLADSAALGAANPAPTLTPFDRLKKYINENRKGGFVDLRTRQAKAAIMKASKGYIGIHGGRVEYWILDSVFKKIAGGDAEAKALKHQLAGKKLLATEKRSNKLNYVVKRPIPGRDRVTTVAIAGPLV